METLDLTGCNKTFETGVITSAILNNSLNNDSLFEEKTTDINVFQEFETTTQFNTDELNSSILFNGEDCEQVGIEIAETTREKCHELTKNMSDSYINVTESLFYQYHCACGPYVCWRYTYGFEFYCYHCGIFDTKTTAKHVP